MVERATVNREVVGSSPIRDDSLGWWVNSSMVEQQFCKLEVRSSTLRSPYGVCSSMVERCFVAAQVVGSSPIRRPLICFFLSCLQLNWMKRRIANSETKGSSPFKHDILVSTVFACPRVWVAQRQSGGLKSLRSVVRFYFQTELFALRLPFWGVQHSGYAVDCKSMLEWFDSTVTLELKGEKVRRA